MLSAASPEEPSDKSVLTTVQLGLYQLDLLDGYPFPEDRAIRVRDQDCDDARSRVTKGRAKLDELTKVAR